MPKFKFICDHNDNLGDGPVLTYETERIGLDEVLFDFTDFLRGCGFVFNGDVQIVDDFATEETTGCGNNCEGCECETPKKSAEWDWTVNQLMKGPITLEDVTKEDEIHISGSDFEINLGDYGAASESIVVPPSVDTITITGGYKIGDTHPSSNNDKCELCGLPKSVMKAHNCWDDNCPKGSW